MTLNDIQWQTGENGDLLWQIEPGMDGRGLWDTRTPPIIVSAAHSQYGSTTSLVVELVYSEVDIALRRSTHHSPERLRHDGPSDDYSSKVRQLLYRRGDARWAGSEQNVLIFS
jgi:hypothetical protein